MTEILDPRFVEETHRQTPLGRWGEPEELARVVGFFVSDKAQLRHRPEHRRGWRPRRGGMRLRLYPGGRSRPFEQGPFMSTQTPRNGKSKVVEREFDGLEIRRIMPQRNPVLLLDQAHVYEGRKALTGIKVVPQNEPFLDGHFPGFPIYPGIWIIEALKQTCECLLRVADPIAATDPGRNAARRVPAGRERGEARATGSSRRDDDARRGMDQLHRRPPYIERLRIRRRGTCR